MMLRWLLVTTLVVLLALRFLPWLLPFWRAPLVRLQVTLDVAGGLVLLLLIGYQLVRGEPIGAVVLALLGVPVFIGMYRALPGWWRGQ